MSRRTESMSDEELQLAVDAFVRGFGQVGQSVAETMNDALQSMAPELEQMILAYEAFGQQMQNANRAMQRLIDTGIGTEEFWVSMLSPAGRLAFRLARWLGAYPMEIIEWLGSCPGAFANEFGEGWTDGD